MGRQSDLLELLEPGPALTPAIPILATFLIEVSTNPPTNMLDGRTTSTEAGDEQDRV